MRRSFPQRHFAVGVLAALLVLGPITATAGAMPTWLPPRALAASQSAEVDNATASDARGNSIIVWRDGQGAVQAVDRIAGRSFGTLRRLSDDGAPPTTAAPAVAMNPAGDAFAVWCQGGQLDIAIRAAGRLFATNLDALGACTGAGGPPHIAVGPARTALVVWQDPGAPCVRWREVQVSGTRYVPLTDAACIGGTGGSRPDVAQNARGDAAITYSDDVAQIATRARRGPFSAGADISTGAASNTAVAVAPDGTVAAAWISGGALEATAGVVGALPPLGASLSAAGATAVGPPDVVFDTAGAAVVGWVDLPGTQVRTATKPRGGVFGAAQPIVGGQFSHDDPVQLAAGPRGDVVLLFSGSGQSARAALRPPGGPFRAAVPFSAAGEQITRIHLALDEEGNGIASMSSKRSGTIEYTLKAAGFDAAGPVMRSVAAPAAGVAGQPLLFSVSPFDRWSAVATTWRFGDGGTATGTSVSHAYGAPGAYTVTVTGVDAVGNASSTVRGVTIVKPLAPDSDGDGFRDDQDCKDHNPRIFPGAREKPENGKDENCDGEDARYPRLDPPAVFWAFDGAKTRFRVTTIRFSDVPNKMRANARCKGAGCPFRKTKTRKSRRHKLNLLPALRGRTDFRAGQTLEVRAIRRGFMGRVVRVKLKQGKVPESVRLCLKPGTKKPRACQ